MSDIFNYCPHCGIRLVVSSRFCHNCGKELTAAAPPTPPAPAPVPERKPEPVMPPAPLSDGVHTVPVSRFRRIGRSSVRPPLSDESLRRIAKLLFGDRENLLHCSSGSAERDAADAIRSLKWYMDSLYNVGVAFDEENVRMYDGRLFFRTGEDTESCYDGGNCCHIRNLYGYRMEILSEEACAGRVSQSRIGELKPDDKEYRVLHKRFDFLSSLPGEDFPVAMAHHGRSLILIRPFGWSYSLELGYYETCESI